MNNLSLSPLCLMHPSTAPMMLSADAWTLWTRSLLFVQSEVAAGYPIGYHDCRWMLGGGNPEKAVAELLGAGLFEDAPCDEYEGFMPRSPGALVRP